MRVLNLVGGFAVLLTTLGFGYVWLQFLVHAPPEAVHNPAFWLGMGVAAAIGIISFIGGCLLLKRGR